MKKLFGIIVATAVIFAPLAAQAGPLQNRIDRQEQRIYKGVRNGSISPREYRHLDRRVDNIEAARLRAIRSGGKLTKYEQRRLNQRLNNTSRSIYRAKHN
ncbi:hypothetical protein [Chamaesiphon minutus]|uniref:DUF4148 domain-containing protein n=1 Tax=Chamaesiphon minutus (strain ATCC 27169 / PCC 6605) TaxID=1173020 RepID=K9UIZ5_CHAP6|nr:hypothetical protein [Chamaesiphon minutus]AFY95087.1 hypothetical protein Cha6605_4140 [Chamaesiphon minutus PCC 6605]